MSSLSELSANGVSIWLDDLGRERLRTGALAKLIAEQHVVGVTTNPSIFAAAVGDGSEYDEQVRELARAGASLDDTVRALAVRDVQWACEVFAQVYEDTKGKNGRVSLEVDPALAGDTAATVAEAVTLWRLVDRPNLMVKIPGTPAGLPAITQTLAEGISVNVTLIFSLQRYEEVVEAWLTGLEQAQAAGRDISGIASVASFFISRMDAAVDHELDASANPAARDVRGKAALANARIAYRQFQAMVNSERWKALAAAGATVQRPLWASTSTKDPTFDDTRYVVELVAPDTVNTMPPKTLHAVADHGVIRGRTIGTDPQTDLTVMEQLKEVGIDYDRVVQQLETEGVAAFEKSWQQFRESVREALESAQHS